MFGVLDDGKRDDDTATTAMLTDLDEMDSDSEGESDDGEDFAVENAPRPPPETPMYGGNGKSHEVSAEHRWEARNQYEPPRGAGYRNEPSSKKWERRGAGNQCEPPRGAGYHNKPSSNLERRGAGN